MDDPTGNTRLTILRMDRFRIGFLILVGAAILLWLRAWWALAIVLCLTVPFYVGVSRRVRAARREPPDPN